MNLAGSFKIIPRKFRSGGIIVIISSLIKALLDLAGLAVLIPVLVLVMSPEGVTGNEWLAKIYVLLNFQSESAFIWAICGLVVLITLLKGGLNIAINRYQYVYLMSLYRHYSRKLLDSYYNRGLLFIKSRNSAKIMYEINNVSLIFVQDRLMNLAGMISDVLLIVLMFTGIIIYNPIAALMVFALFVPIIYIYIRSIRGRLLDYGRLENEEKRKQNRIVQEVFRGYSEIEINNAFPDMETQFDAGLKKISKFRRTILTVQQTPGVIIETGIAMALAALVVLKVDAILLGIFGVVAMRMLPAVKNVVNRWILMRNSSYAQDIIWEGIKTPPVYSPVTSERMEFKDRITTEDLTFSFTTDDPPVIDNLSIEIRKGERIGIKGVSGGGKTTLFNLLLGLYPPTSGRILVDGTPITGDNRRMWQNIIGYVPQEVFVMDSSIAENIALGCEIDRERVLKVLNAACLGDFLAGLPDGIDTQIGEAGSRLSGGQKQRLGIARALYKNAEVLFFDEATSALDSKTEHEINDAIRELSETHTEITIIIIAHRESSLAFCDRVIEIGRP